MNVIKNAFDQNDTPYDRDPSKNTFAQFLLNGGLYEKFEITRTNIQDLIDVLNGNVRINLFCKDCGENRIFSMKEMLFPFIGSEGFQAMRGLGKEISEYQRVQELCATPQPGEQCVENKWDWTNWQMWDYTRVMVFQYRCALNDNHFADFVVRANGNTLVKIGQYPSVADLTFPELERYKKVLNETERRELRRAIGLYSAGIGAGSYVYLRRVFERILAQARTNAGDAINSVAYDTARVKDKISMLKDYLPTMLTSNVALYGILSKGIHELSEEECITYFPVVKDCIFMILDEWEEVRKKTEKERAISTSLSKIATRIM